MQCIFKDHFSDFKEQYDYKEGLARIKCQNPNCAHDYFIEYPQVSAQGRVIEASMGWRIIGISGWISVIPSSGVKGAAFTVTVDFNQFLPNETISGYIQFLNTHPFHFTIGPQLC